MKRNIESFRLKNVARKMVTQLPLKNATAEPGSEFEFVEGVTPPSIVKSAYNDLQWPKQLQK